MAAEILVARFRAYAKLFPDDPAVLYWTGEEADDETLGRWFARFRQEDLDRVNTVFEKALTVDALAAAEVEAEEIKARAEEAARLADEDRLEAEHRALLAAEERLQRQAEDMVLVSPDAEVDTEAYELLDADEVAVPCETDSKEAELAEREAALAERELKLQRLAESLGVAIDLD